MKDQIDELTLLLLYLTSFSDDYGLGEAPRSWKGYPFESLDELRDKQYITGSNRAKSVFLPRKELRKHKNL